MTPRLSEKGWENGERSTDKLVTDEEGTDDESTEASTRGREKQQKERPAQVPERVLRKHRGNLVPRVGDQCMILIGRTRPEVR